MSEKYKAIDAALLADIKARPRRGYADFSAAIDEAYKSYPGAIYRGADRYIDRRLQSLRKRGLIQHKDAYWRLANDREREK